MFTVNKRLYYREEIHIREWLKKRLDFASVEVYLKEVKPKIPTRVEGYFSFRDKFSNLSKMFLSEYGSRQALVAFSNC
jgi:hypothetical protein